MINLGVINNARVLVLEILELPGRSQQSLLGE